MKSGLIAFAFGTPAKILSNARIGRIASFVARQKELPVFTQKDVPMDSDISDVTYATEKNGQPPSTLRVATEALDWVHKNQILDLWLVAAKPQLWRCQRDLTVASQRARRTIILRECEEINNYPDEDWFCCESYQLRTRWKPVWIMREGMIKMMPLFLYRKLTQ